jgi:hypothetical protein
LNNSKLAIEQTDQNDIQLIDDHKEFPLEAISAFLDAIHLKGIRYCHWKSNSRLDWGLTGRTDLDLLIDPTQESLFKKILAGLEIKKIVAPPLKQYPGLEHYLGFDSATGNLFHLHVHYNLVLGEQHVKNYRIPIEDKVLDLTQDKYGVKIPLPEVELIILSIRAMLKYRDRDGVKDIFSIRFPGIPEHILNELLWLLEQSSPEKLEKLLSELSIFSDQNLILEFLDVVKNAPRDGWKLLSLRARLRKELRPYQRKSRIFATFQYFRTLLQNTRFFKGRKNQLLKFPNGGKLIAVIGIDGSGKSTHTVKLAKWLEWKVSAPLHYLGSKQPSLWSEWSYVIFRIFRRSNTILSKRLGSEFFLARILRKIRQFFLAAHYYSVGKDRLKRFKLGLEEAQKGSIVIFDRFPFFSPLDGPEIHLIPDEKLFYLPQKLSMMEKRLYQQFNTLDQLLVLNVNPEVSVERKPDHPMETIQSKFEALSRLKTELSEQPGQFDRVQIDANMPLDQVNLALKRAVWSIL